MSQERLPAPQPEECLILSRKSRYKGGTMVAEDVWTLEEHERRVADPDGYRPEVCARCEGRALHVHDYLERKPLGRAKFYVLTVVRFICAEGRCGATWRVLPAFAARHLWWTWRAVETASVQPAVEAAGLAVAATKTEPATPAGVATQVEPATPAGVATQVEPETPAVAATKTEPATPAGVATQVEPETPAVAATQAEPETPAATATQAEPERGGRALVVPGRTRRRWRARLRSSARQLVVPEVGRRLGCVAALVDRLERGIRLM
jgi:hypothetical protein